MPRVVAPMQCPSPSQPTSVKIQSCPTGCRIENCQLEIDGGMSEARPVPGTGMARLVGGQLVSHGKSDAAKALAELGRFVEFAEVPRASAWSMARQVSGSS